MYASCALPSQALLLLSTLATNPATQPLDQFTLAAALPAATSPRHVAQLHAYGLRAELLPRPGPAAPLLNALISAYAKNNLFRHSHRLLEDVWAPDVVTFSGIISAMAHVRGREDEALGLFRRLVGLGLGPDAVALACFLPMAQSRHCRELHGHAVRAGSDLDRRVRNGLIAAYGRCGLAAAARAVFEHGHGPRSRDVVSWGAMIMGLARNSLSRPALELFAEMVHAGLAPNPVILTSVLAACSTAAAVRQGKELHQWAARRGLDTGQTFVGCALVDMYAKCGRIREARWVFDRIHYRNVATCNAMIIGYAFHGRGEEALQIFAAMEEPDEVSFVAALSACGHSGLVQKGVEIFGFLEQPRVAHYACMVDLLGRAGEVGRARELVRAMPVEPSEAAWGALLGACRLGRELGLGLESGEQAIWAHDGDLGRGAGYYVTVSNLLAESGLWGEVASTRRAMSESGMKKDAACSWIQVQDKVHVFVSKDRAQHPEWVSLRRVLFFLAEQMERGI